MSNNNKNKSETKQTSVQVAVQVLPTKAYGYVMFRHSGGWMTKMIEMGTDGTVKICATGEPDTKVNALYKGERWISAKSE